MSKEILEQEIRERAYALWQSAGQPEGGDEDFWTEAKTQLAKEKGIVDVDKASEESFPASDPVNHM